MCTRDLISGILVCVRRLFHLATPLRVLTCALLTLGTAHLSGLLSLVLPRQFWCKCGAFILCFIHCRFFVDPLLCIQVAARHPRPSVRSPFCLGPIPHWLAAYVPLSEPVSVLLPQLWEHCQTNVFWPASVDILSSRIAISHSLWSFFALRC